MNYVPLHCHTHFSAMDGIATPEEYAFRANALEMKAVAMTDHGTLAGHRAMYRAAKAQGVKPILGIEGYFAPDRFDKREKATRTEKLDQLYNHIIVLAKNANGLENLNKINEIAWTEGFYTKPRMDFELLDKYGEDLIVSSACMGGLINQAIEQNEYAVAKNHLRWFSQRFGDDFYVELMPHNIAGMNTALYDMANAMGIKSIVTPDCHHCTIDQKVEQEIMLALSTHPKLEKDVTYEKSKSYKNMMDRLDYLYGRDRKMSFNKFDIHLLSYDEMHAAMDSDGEFDESIYTNTVEIADKVEDYQIKSNLNLLPLKVDDPDTELSKLAFAGLKRRGLFDYPEYVERLQHELGIIKSKKFSAYFLVVENMITWAVSQGIYVGPGRGSSAGSLVCYALGITQIDPIARNLLFSRFIDEGRSDFPDIDTDFPDNRRDEVKAYLEREYGHVAAIATFVKFGGKGDAAKPGGKGLVRDVARIFNIPLTDVNKVCKGFESWDQYTSSNETAWFRTKYPEVERYGERLIGRIRSTGMHPAGIVTSSEPVFKYGPLETAKPAHSDIRVPILAIDMDEAADIGFIKIDALGLKTLSVIKDALDSIKTRHGFDINMLEISTSDPAVYRMLADGNTKGVFQCEAGPSTNLIMKMNIKTFDELVASNALVRPGAMNTIGKEYLSRSRGKGMTDYIHPLMQSYVQDTYGLIIYQEQVMQACTVLGGMTDAEANKVRRIIGKKKDAREFDQFKDKFIAGALGHIGVEKAAKLWHDFEAHAGYSFNKSHAEAYSLLSYWTAWLKFYYPTEFMFAILKNEGDKDVRTEYIIEAKRMGIPIKLPHINESDADFKIEGKGIRMGLTTIKSISDKVASRIIKHRPYASYESFMEIACTKGSGINSAARHALDIIGAIAFPDHISNEQSVRDNLYEYLNLPEFNIQLPSHFYSFIDNSEDYEENAAHIVMGVAKKIKRGNGWTMIDFLDKTGMIRIFDEADTQIEKGKTYIVLAGSNRIAKAICTEDLATTKGDSLLRYLNLKSIPYGQDEAYVLSFKPRKTKKGDRMAHMVVADYDRNLLPVTVFPRQFAQAFMKCEPGTVHKMVVNEMKDGTLALGEVY
jgi:DNA polymerase-3 subunit alpha